MATDAEIEVHCAENTELSKTASPLKAWKRSEYSHACLSHCYCAEDFFPVCFCFYFLVTLIIFPLDISLFFFFFSFFVSPAFDVVNGEIRIQPRMLSSLLLCWNFLPVYFFFFFWPSRYIDYFPPRYLSLYFFLSSLLRLTWWTEVPRWARGINQVTFFCLTSDWCRLLYTLKPVLK